MSSPHKRTICIGEAIVEQARGVDGRFALTSSGDTFNTAIHIARAGVTTASASALGDDPYPTRLCRSSRLICLRTGCWDTGTSRYSGLTKQ